jgi:hypothetical protein
MQFCIQGLELLAQPAATENTDVAIVRGVAAVTIIIAAVTVVSVTVPSILSGRHNLLSRSTAFHWSLVIHRRVEPLVYAVRLRVVGVWWRNQTCDRMPSESFLEKTLFNTVANTAYGNTTARRV